MSFLDKLRGHGKKKVNAPLPPPPAPGSVDKESVKVSDVVAQQPFELPPVGSPSSPSSSGLPPVGSPSSPSSSGLPPVGSPSSPSSSGLPPVGSPSSPQPVSSQKPPNNPVASREQVRSVFSDVLPITANPDEISNEAVEQMNVDNLKLPRFGDDFSADPSDEEEAEEIPSPEDDDVLNLGSKNKESVLPEVMPSPEYSEDSSEATPPSQSSPVHPPVPPANTDEVFSDEDVMSVAPIGPLYVDVVTYERVQKSIKNLKKQLDQIQTDMQDIKKLREGEDKDVAQVVKKLEKIQSNLLNIDADLFED